MRGAGHGGAGVQGPACFMLLSCVQLVPAAAAQLCQQQGGPEVLHQLAAILQACHASDKVGQDPSIQSSLEGWRGLWACLSTPWQMPNGILIHLYLYGLDPPPGLSGVGMTTLEESNSLCQHQFATVLEICNTCQDQFKGTLKTPMVSSVLSECKGEAVLVLHAVCHWSARSESDNFSIHFAENCTSSHLKNVVNVNFDAQAGGEAGETVELMLAHIGLRQGLLGPLLQALCSPPHPAQPAWAHECFQPIHSLTLHVLAEEVQTASEAGPPSR